VNDVARASEQVRPQEDYRQTSFWLASTTDDLTPRKPLAGNLTVDVAILGGGFSGLWTAYYLLRDNPGIEVAILEKEICGFGASGRNGGWCSGRFPVDADVLRQRVGPTRARETILALYEAVEEIGRVVAAEGIDAHYRKTGLLNIARGEAQMPAIRAAFDVYERLCLGSHNRLLSAAEARELIQVTKLSGAMLTSIGATVHPANLARGLARCVERLGGTIFERSEVTRFKLGDQPRLVTESGSVTARRAVVAAGEAYLTRLPPFRRALLPISSMIVLTAPLNEAQWQEIGWRGGQSLSSQSKTKNYLTRTVDGRILYGSRGAPYHFGSRISDAALQDASVFECMRGTVREWFPVLERVEFTHAWGGHLGVPRDWMPTVDFDSTAKLARLHGYTGRGVSTTNLAARLAAGLISRRRSGLEELPLHRRQMRLWEPEPLRWAAVRYIQNAFARIDRAEETDRACPWDAPLAKYLGDQ
jgi:glycine/D-amino acid oxidase-like deaminating enzyme